MNLIRRLIQQFNRRHQPVDSAPPRPALPPINITQTIRENFGEAIGAVINMPDPNKEWLDEARLMLIERVKAQWIAVDGAPRAQQAALQAITSDHCSITGRVKLLPLRKRFVADAVNFTSGAAAVVAHLAADHDDEANQIPLEQPIAEIFAQSQQSLLILGEAGVGKTVTMLQLAEAALARVATNPTATDHPVPVILNLAAWAQEQLPLGEWVIQELKTIQYGIPADVVRVWLRKHDLLLLLDGLNELNDYQRRLCVTALNTYIADHGTTPLVVCCRAAEYDVLPLKLTLRRAIHIDRLDDAQLRTYWAETGTTLAALQNALEQDTTLRKLATTPLMLHIMSIAYANVERAEIATETATAGQHSVERERRHLFELYVVRMLRYGGTAAKSYTDSELTGWLAWLAHQMFQQNRPVFLIEQLQPSWLPTVGWQWVYMFAARITVGLLVGAFGGIAIGMALGPSDGYGYAFLRGITEGPLTGLISGAVIALVDMLWIRIVAPILTARRISQLWQSLLKILLTMLNVSMIVATLFALLLGPTRFLGWDMATWWHEGRDVGLLSGLSAALLFAFGPQAIRYSLRQDIQTVERVSWSRIRAWRNGLIAVLIGVLAGAIAALIDSGTPMMRALTGRGMSESMIVVTMMVMGGGFLGLVGVVFGGFTGTFRKIQKVTPNQGLRLSLINASLVALIVGAIFGTLGGLLGWVVSGGSTASAISYTFYGLFIGVLGAMWYGLLFAIQHGVLRLLLWWAGHTPPVGQYARLLDDAARHIFLQKVGGGYKFVNRYLQEYFAMLC